MLAVYALQAAQVVTGDVSVSCFPGRAAFFSSAEYLSPPEYLSTQILSSPIVLFAMELFGNTECDGIASSESHEHSFLETDGTSPLPDCQ